MDIEDVIEEKYTNWLNCETDELDLTIEEAKHILVNDHKQRYVDELLEESWKTVLSELEKKEAVINEMAEMLSKRYCFAPIPEKCNQSACDFDKSKCILCIIEYFTNKVESRE